MKKRAVVLISGGVDSTTCLAVAKQEGFDCYALTFDYGQRSRAEVNAAKQAAKIVGAKQHKIISLDLSQFGGSALTETSINVPDYQGSNDIPITYVPARNTIFLSIALGWAEVLQAHGIFIGVSAIDYSGYPDCRPEYINAFQQMADLATKAGITGNPIKIHTPLIQLTKAQTIQLGIRLGIDYGITVTCYQASDTGKACGRCDSCTLRRNGFKTAGITDPTIYA